MTEKSSNVKFVLARPLRLTYQLADDVHVRVQHRRVDLLGLVEVRQQATDDGVLALDRLIAFLFDRLKPSLQFFTFYFSQYITPFTFNFRHIQASKCVFLL
jgi:hypothetical protein